jgi:hypothetical protein
MAKAGPRISVYGRDKAYRDLIRGAGRWMASELMGPRLCDTLTVKIKLVKNLLKDEGVLGDCEWIDDNKRPREFVIRLYAGPNRKRTLKTLAHEMVHVKQFARSEMYDHVQNIDLVTWKGQRVDSNQVSYEDQPWEKEAYEMEVPLLNKWAMITSNDSYVWKSRIK